MNKLPESCPKPLGLFKALADETRLRLLNLLARAELSVQDLTSILQMGQSRISRHLKILHQAGLLGLQRQGTWSYYRLAPAEAWLEEMWRLLEPRLVNQPACGEDLRQMARLAQRRQAETRDFFNRHAGQWDRIKQEALPLVTYQERLLQLVGGGRMLIEVGTGTGSLLPALCRSWRQLIGIDQAPGMLDQAGRRLAEVAACKVELKLGEMSALPVEEHQADAVLMNMVLHHALRPLPVFKEVHRVLRPGGRIVLADLQRHAHDWARDVLADIWLGFEPEELEDWLLAAGFGDISIEKLDGDQRCQGVLLVTAATV